MTERKVSAQGVEVDADYGRFLSIHPRLLRADSASSVRCESPCLEDAASRRRSPSKNHQKSSLVLLCLRLRGALCGVAAKVSRALGASR